MRGANTRWHSDTKNINLQLLCEGVINICQRCRRIPAAGSRGLGRRTGLISELSINWGALLKPGNTIASWVYFCQLRYWRNMCGRCNKTRYPSSHLRSQQLPRHGSLKRHFDEWPGGGKLLMPLPIVAAIDCIDATQGLRAASGERAAARRH